MNMMGIGSKFITIPPLMLNTTRSDTVIMNDCQSIEVSCCSAYCCRGMMQNWGKTCVTTNQTIIIIIITVTLKLP